MLNLIQRLSIRRMPCAFMDPFVWEDVKRLQELTTAVEQEASTVGLGVNSNKCRVMVSGGWEGSADIYGSRGLLLSWEHWEL